MSVQRKILIIANTILAVVLLVGIIVAVYLTADDAENGQVSNSQTTTGLVDTTAEGNRTQDVIFSSTEDTHANTESSHTENETAADMEDKTDPTENTTASKDTEGASTQPTDTEYEEPGTTGAAVPTLGENQTPWA